jgi:hypothetical protein
MKCPDCGQYSLTYDFERNGFWCEIYHGFIPAEHMSPLSPAFMLHRLIRTIFEKLTEIGAFG